MHHNWWTVGWLYSVHFCVVFKFGGKESDARNLQSWKISGQGHEVNIFLPCDAMRCTILVIVILSVCPSVCLSVRLSVTLVHCVHMVRPRIVISSPYGSHIILVSGDITFIPKIRRGSPQERALNEGGVGTNWRFSTNKSPYLPDGARYDKGYY